MADTVQSVTISTIVDDDCGVLFRTGSLTDEGAEVMRKTYGVPAVVYDITLVPDDLSDSPIHSEKRSDKKLQGSKPLQEQVEKRDIFGAATQGSLQSLPSFQVPPKRKPLSITCTTLRLEKVLPFRSSTGVSIHHTPNSVLVLSKDGSMPMASPKRRLMMIPVRMGLALRLRSLGGYLGLRRKLP